MAMRQAIASIENPAIKILLPQLMLGRTWWSEGHITTETAVMTIDPNTKHIQNFAIGVIGEAPIAPGFDGQA